MNPPQPEPTVAPVATAPSPARAAQPYRLAKLPIFVKVLYYLKANHLESGRLEPRQALVRALEYAQQILPELFVVASPAAKPSELVVTVSGAQRTFSLAGVDTPWALYQSLGQICGFIEANMQPLPEEQRQELFAEIESALANGMLNTLNPWSVVLEPKEFEQLIGPQPGGVARGGVGLVVERAADQTATIRRILPEGTGPGAGLRPGDRIIRIGGRDTAPMTLAQIVDELQGPVGSTVDLQVQRPGQTSLYNRTVSRVPIRAPSLDPPARILTAPATAGRPGAIGYLRLRFFGTDAKDAVSEALAGFAKQRLSGIIIDLRGNTGGLYDQAAKIADAFIAAGTIVSLVDAKGAAKQKEIADDDGNEPKVPLAVLVDGRSAAASEILAAAFKDLERGIVIGETTSGKGSVEMLFNVSSPIARKGAAHPERFGLKLTTAQWLTPRGRGIEGTGVTPDIAVVRSCVKADSAGRGFSLEPATINWRRTGRAGSAVAARADAPPSETVDYFHLLEPGHDCKPQPEDDDPSEAIAESDFVLRLARDLLARASAPDRRAVLADARNYLDRARSVEDQKLTAALARRGIDWSAGPAMTAGRAQVTLEAQRSPGKVSGTATLTLRASVKNVGAASLHRVRLPLASSHGLVDGRQLAVGNLAPGQTRAAELTIEVPAAGWRRTDVVSARVVARSPVEANRAETTVRDDGSPPPRFKYRYEAVEDSGKRAGEGQRTVRLKLEVTNVGAGRVHQTEALLRTRPKREGVVVTAGMGDVSDLGPGESRTLPFEYQLDPAVARGGQAFELLLRGRTSIDAPLTSTIRIEPDAAGRAAGRLTPPLVTVTAPELVRQPTVHVTGVATDDEEVTDLTVFVRHASGAVWPRKVLYLYNRGDRKRLPFAAEVPLQPGLNMVQVVARQDATLHTATTLAVVYAAP